MQSSILISFIADDRPGLVQDISEVISAHGGNWLESRMARLSGKFAGIVNVSLPGEQHEALTRALQGMESIGATLRTEIAQAPAEEPPSVPFRLEIIGHDRPGIVHEFSAALAGRRINVIDMRSDITSAPMSGDPLFTASAGIQVPPEIDIDELRERLETIADELMIEYSLAPVA